MKNEGAWRSQTLSAGRVFQVAKFLKLSAISLMKKENCQVLTFWWQRSPYFQQYHYWSWTFSYHTFEVAKVPKLSAISLWKGYRQLLPFWWKRLLNCLQYHYCSRKIIWSYIFGGKVPNLSTTLYASSVIVTFGLCRPRMNTMTKSYLG